MTPRLRHEALPRVHENQRQVGSACAGDHVAGVLLVARRVGDDEFSPVRVEIAVRDVDGDALFALCLQSVRQEGKIDAFAAASFVVTLGCGDLIFKRAARIDEKASDQCGFAVVDAAGSNEPKEANAQKYPSRFLSSIVFAP